MKDFADVRLKRIEIASKKSGLCKDCCSQKISCNICNVCLNRSSLNSHEKSKYKLLLNF